MRTKVKDIEVSTVRIPCFIDEINYETCIFYSNDSEVVETYHTLMEAMYGHWYWVKQLRSK